MLRAQAYGVYFLLPDPPSRGFLTKEGPVSDGSRVRSINAPRMTRVHRESHAFQNSDISMQTWMI